MVCLACDLLIGHFAVAETMRMERSTTQSVPPQPVALIVCDNVYQESGGKNALVGLFSKIIASRFPATHSRMVVYVAVTDVRPNSVGRLEIVHGETDELVAGMQGPIKVDDPVQIVEMIFVLEKVTFPEPGLYFVRFSANDRPLLSRPFLVVKSEGRTDE